MHPFDTLRLLRSTLRRVSHGLPQKSSASPRWRRIIVQEVRAHRDASEVEASKQRAFVKDIDFYIANVTEHKRLVALYRIGYERSMRERIAAMAHHVGLAVPDFRQFDAPSTPPQQK
eukprot:c5319_g1_i2.p2 GENE.c5319_g1_i2~~c5319_g1_i2.p2  ORF type:complete len:117 (+),score=14.99 c5319_g1_i2:393-743(+)